MVRNYKKVEKPYTQATIEIAVKEVQDGASIRATSAKHRLSFSLLRKHVKKSENEEFIKEDMRGKKTERPTDLEEKIADTVRRMEKMGLGPTLLEFRHIVKDYLLANGIETLFKDSLPGYEWAKSFMHRHNMTLKTGGMMQLARKSVTSDPFVIYGADVDKRLFDPSTIAQEGSPGCSHWLDVQGPTDKDELLEDIKKDIQQRGTLYAKNLSWTDLVNENSSKGSNRNEV
ncbi:uncharacterized protein [Macrobrachium rosenbergii]|uniref:uncharacterized protein n=1 Tax=Macrobrachium rosenbergii TaxID=79674 RepID=UPI0034D45625